MRREHIASDQMQGKARREGGLQKRKGREEEEEGR